MKNPPPRNRIGIKYRPGGETGWATSGANGRVILTGAKLDDTIETADRADRAHTVYGPDGMLVSAERLNGEARPRRYPRCYMAEVVHLVPEAGGAGGERRRRVHLEGHVSFESVFDATYEREQRLRAMGLIGDVGEGLAIADVLRHPRHRDIVRRVTVQRDWVSGKRRHVR